MRKNLSDLVKGWLAKGDSDLSTAVLCASGTGPYDTGCFHCQQAVEKYLKAVLNRHGKVPPKTHNLRQLIQEIEKLEPALGLKRPEVLALTAYAVKLRYDAGFWPNQMELSNAVAVARQVRLEILVVIPANMHPTSGPP
jgi:HEPN domain-containing protein